MSKKHEYSIEVNKKKYLKNQIQFVQKRRILSRTWCEKSDVKQAVQL